MKIKHLGLTLGILGIALSLGSCDNQANDDSKDTDTTTDDSNQTVESKKIYKENMFCYSLDVHYDSNEEYKLAEDEKIKAVYFYDSYNKTTFDLLEVYSKEITVVAVASTKQKHNEAKQEVSNSNLVFAYEETKNEGISSFLETPKYPYLVGFDMYNKIVVHTDLISSRSLNTLLVNSGVRRGKDVGKLVPEVSLTLMEDETLYNNVESTGKITVLNFWGTWCTPCVSEMPHFISMSKKYENISFIATHSNYRYEKSEVEEFIRNHWSDTGNIIFAADDSNETAYHALTNASSYPVTIIVDELGYIRFTKTGSMSESELESALLEVLS